MQIFTTAVSVRQPSSFSHQLRGRLKSFVRLLPVAINCRVTSLLKLLVTVSDESSHIPPSWIGQEEPYFNFIRLCLCACDGFSLLDPCFFPCQTTAIILDSLAANFCLVPGLLFGLLPEYWIVNWTTLAFYQP